MLLTAARRLRTGLYTGHVVPQAPPVSASLVTGATRAGRDVTGFRCGRLRDDGGGRGGGFCLLFIRTESRPGRICSSGGSGAEPGSGLPLRPEPVLDLSRFWKQLHKSRGSRSWRSRCWADVAPLTCLLHNCGIMLQDDQNLNLNRTRTEPSPVRRVQTEHADLSPRCSEGSVWKRLVDRCTRSSCLRTQPTVGLDRFWFWSWRTQPTVGQDRFWFWSWRNCML